MTITTVFEPRLEENFQQLTTPNYQVFQTVAEARLGAWDATKSDSQVCYVEEKEAFYNYCSTCGLPDDGDLVLTTSAGGTSRWEMVQKVSRTQGDNGWIDRDGLTVSKLNSTTLRANLTSNAYYAVNSTRVTLAAGNYDISFTGTARTIAVFFNASGTLSQSNNVPADLFTSTPVAVVYWTGTQIGGIQTEFHGIRDTVWHAWAHKYLGTQYDSGLAITTNTQPDSNADPAVDTVQYLWLTTGTIFDEDTAIDIGTGNWLQTLGSGLTNTTAAVIPFFYYNATAGAVIGVAANADREPFLFTGANGYPQREVNGVLTNGANGEYITYHYFASPFIDGYSVFARPHNNTTAFTTLLAAQAARPSSLTWSAIGEFKHIYSVIFRLGNWGNTPTHNCKIVSVQDFRLVSSGPASGTNASTHGALSGLADAGAHPATAIASDTTNFDAELSTSEINVQLALDRLDDYDSLLDWATGKSYRVGNVFKVTLEGFEGAWRTTTAHTASAAFTSDLANVELISSWMGPREMLAQPSASYFSAGQVVTFSNASGEYVKGLASDSDLAEVKGIVSGATASYFILSKTGSKVILSGGWTPALTTGAVQFLSGATAGAITATEPSTVSYIRLPLGQAVTTTTLDVLVGQGTTVGGTNLYTTIPLNNGTATTIQSLAGDTTFPINSGGFIEGFVTIDTSTTDYIFTFKVEYTKTGSTTIRVTPSYGAGDVPPGLTITDSGANIQINWTTLSGFNSASARFSMQAANVGATLPLQISGSQVTGPVLGSTSGAAPASGFVGEIIEYSGSTTAMTTNQWNDCGCAPVVLGVGIWDLQAQCYFNPTSGSTVSSQYIIGIGTVTGNDATGVLNVNSTQLVNQTSGGTAANFSTPLVRVRVTSGTVSYYPKALASFTVSGVQGTAYIRARRVA